MKRRFYILLIALLILSSPLTANAAAQPRDKPDTRVQGVVRGIQHDFVNVLDKVPYQLNALITLQITEIAEKPGSFPYGAGSPPSEALVDISYNYSGRLGVKAGNLVEVYGLWIVEPSQPTSQTILVDINIFGSYLRVLSAHGGSAEVEDEGSHSIETSSEYSNGSIPLGPGVNLWYVWINTSSTQVAFFTYYSTVYNSPLQYFLGQHYRTTDGLEVFMGNTLLLMEAYRDTNNNGFPDVDLARGTGEVEYFFLVNSSLQFTPTPVQRGVVEGVPHYRWGVRYEGIDGFLLYPKDRVIDGVQTNIAAEVYLNHITLTYDYYLQGNTSYLKTGVDIGQITTVIPRHVGVSVSLNGLGISLLYGTTTITSMPYTVLVNGQPYNSRTIGESTILAERAQVVVGSMKTYEFLFEENYTLHRDSLTESHRSKSVASATESVPSNAYPYLSPYWVRAWLGRYLSDTFPQITNLNLNYDTSSFVYRVCYPTWEGRRLEHDPTYVAYLSPELVEYPSGGPRPPRLPVEQLGVALVGSVALAWAIIELRRTRRFGGAVPLASRFQGG